MFANFQEFSGSPSITYVRYNNDKHFHFKNKLLLSFFLCVDFPIRLYRHYLFVCFSPLFICWSGVIDPCCPLLSEYQRTPHQTWAVRPQQRRTSVFLCWERTANGEPRCTECWLTTSAWSSLIYWSLCLRWVKRNHVKSKHWEIYLLHDFIQYICICVYIYNFIFFFCD